MLEFNSRNSQLCSIIQSNSKSLNPLDSLDPTIINKIKKDAQTYVGCTVKCEKIWEALSKNDFTGYNLTQNVIEGIFNEFKDDLSQFLRINSFTEFMNIFDQDKDGCLDYEEQIQIFSLIKERIELVANHCLQIQAYLKFQELMREVRSLQEKIAKWQEQCREKIHSGQISKYQKEQKIKIDEFCDHFDKEFESIQKIMLYRRQNFENKTFLQTQFLEEKLSSPRQYLKIKPKNRLKQLQFQEKLVGLEQRVSQAVDFRKQLNQLEVEEKNRVDALIMSHAEKKRKNLRHNHQKQRKQLQVKLEEIENKLLLKMKKKFDMIKKKSTIFKQSIQKIQRLQKKQAIQRGLKEPQLKRIKKFERQRNQVLSEFKKSMVGVIKPNHSSSGKVNLFNENPPLNSLMKFKLVTKTENELPINKKSVKVENNYNAEINKYIRPHHSQKTFSLCRLYDRNLEEEGQYPLINQLQKEQQKNRKYGLTMSKLL